MLGPRQEAQAALFYEFSLEDHVPQDHLLRSIDRFVDLSDIRHYLTEYYSHTGRPSVDPELLIRMLLVGYCFGIRSERRLPSVPKTLTTDTRRVYELDRASLQSCVVFDLPAFGAVRWNTTTGTEAVAVRFEPW